MCSHLLLHSDFVNKICAHTHTTPHKWPNLYCLYVYLSTSIAFLSFRIQTVARRYSRFCFIFLSLFFSFSSFVCSFGRIWTSTGCLCAIAVAIVIVTVMIFRYRHFSLLFSFSLYFESIYHLIYKVTVWFSNYFLHKNGIARRNNRARKKKSATTISTTEQWFKKNGISSTHIMKSRKKNIYFASEKKEYIMTMNENK